MRCVCVSRHWPWILAGLILALVAWHLAAGRPMQSMAEQAAAYDAKRAADPVFGPEDKAVGEALRALLEVTAAPDLALQAQEQWREDRVPDGTADRSYVVPAPDRAASLLQQAASWRAALLRRPSTDELAQTCVYQVPYAQCTVRGSGEVPGSHGGLRYQAAGRFLAERQGPDADQLFQADEAASRSDPMVGATVDIFDADPAGGWRMVLAIPAQPSERPEQIASPAGPLLSVAKGDPSGPALYALVEGRWRYLYQAAWMQALAAKAPAGTCLDGAFYLGNWPWPAQLVPELSRLGLNPATLTVDSAYFANGAKAALVHATVGREGDELVLRTAVVQVLAPASFWAREFGRCRGVPF